MAKEANGAAKPGIDWAGLGTNVLNRATDVLATRLKPEQAQNKPAVVPQAPAKNYMPWIIGGVVALLVLGGGALMLMMGGRRRGTA